MDLPPTASAASPGRPARRGRQILRVSLLIFILLLFAIFLLLVLSNNSSRQFKWLTDEQFSQSFKSGPPTKLLDKVEYALDSLWQRFHNNPHFILNTTSLMLLSPAATAQTNLGAPFSTNSSGARAWILSPTELATLQAQFKSDPGVVSLSSPRARTSDDNQCRASITRSVSLSPGNSTNVGITIDVRTKSSSRSVNLLLRATSTDLDATHGPAAIKTNFFAACRVVIPDAGAVVIDCGRSSTADQPDYWLIVSPLETDLWGVPFNRR